MVFKVSEFFQPWKLEKRCWLGRDQAVRYHSFKDTKTECLWTEWSWSWLIDRFGFFVGIVFGMRWAPTCASPGSHETFLMRLHLLYFVVCDSSPGSLNTFQCEVGRTNQINKISQCSSRTPWSTAAFIATVWKLDQAFHSTVARKFVALKNYPSCNDITPQKHTQLVNQLLKTKRNCPAISHAGEIKSNPPRDMVPTRPTKRFSIFQPLLGFPDVFYSCVLDTRLEIKPTIKDSLPWNQS